jgi:ribonucleoside-diphosphate reductase alpha chain
MFTAGLVSGEGFLDPLDAVEWGTRSVKIVGAKGTVFEMEDVSAPKTWSQNSTDIAASKYFRKAGVPGTGHENSVKQLVSRVARAVRLAGERQVYFAAPEDADAFEAELKHILVTQRAAFNSPVWFNCGLKEAYGITGTAAGNAHWNPAQDKVIDARDSYTHPQVSACFINKIDDDLMDIAEHIKREMRIFKYGSGAGANFSKLRAKGERLSNGGASSGLMSFLEVFDRAAGAIKSGGTTRRAAKMVCLDVDHPDIEDFIMWKSREEDKARALMEAGFGNDLNSEAYRTVSGQNANNSVRVTDEFMAAALDGRDYETRWRTTGEVASRKSARTVLRKIAEAAHRCADPGLQYDSTINRWHPCKGTSRINGSNPCSEYMYVDDSACNLASVNLVHYVNSKGVFQVEEFIHTCKTLILAQEILVDYASYPTREIARNSHEHRPLGLGYANLGGMLMRRGIPYDSDEGRGIAASVTALMTGAAYERSAEVAAIKGPFVAYKANRDPFLEVMEMHRAAVTDIEAVGGHDMDIFRAASEVWDSALVKGRQHGYRNAQTTLLAPTGTIGLLMDCDTTGIEPDFSLVKYKKLAGGGSMKIVNQSVRPALARLGYDESRIERAIAYLDGYETLEGCDLVRPEHLPVFDCSVRCGKRGTRYIAAMGHVKMMAAVQPFLSGAISKTVNVPNESTVEDIERLYVEGWRRGLKALAIYRDGSKTFQVLSTQQDKDKTVTPQPRRVRLQNKRDGHTFALRVGGQKVYLRTGLYPDGSVGELFIDMHKEGAFTRSMTNCFAIAVSLGLQHGVPLETFVERFSHTNFAPNGPVHGHDHVKFAGSVIDLICRVLGFEYLDRIDLVQVKPEGAVAVEDEGPAKLDGSWCDICGGLTRISGTCKVCTNCGETTGCG